MRRAELVREARDWVGTPYLAHQGCKAAGADCLGFITGLWAQMGGPRIELPLAYNGRWDEPGDEEKLWQGLAGHLLQIAPVRACPGDLLLFRFHRRAIAKHVALVSEGAGEHIEKIVHAYLGHGVVESAMPHGWKGRVVAAFRFPMIRE